MNSVLRQTFRSRVDWWYWQVCLAELVLGFLSVYSGTWVVYFILWAVAIYMISLTFLIRYVVEGETLTVFYGFFLKKRIPISAITSIQPTHNPISSPAMSLRRLLIRYGKYDEVLVSPVDQEAFIAALKAVNPNIENFA